MPPQSDVPYPYHSGLSVNDCRERSATNPQTRGGRDVERICALLARFSQFTQQFEREEQTTHDNKQPEKAEAVGTVSNGMGNTRPANRRASRRVSAPVNKKATQE
jgi:hypothetical protein